MSKPSMKRACWTGLAVLLVGLGAGAASCDGKDAVRSVRSPAERVRGAPLPTGTLRIGTAQGTVVVRVEIAETPETRRRGLMHRPTLAPNAGMVFLFESPASGLFWMKNTLIPLSVAFWDRSGHIVAILDMEPCRADPCRLYSPRTTYIGAVEVNRGFFSLHGVSIGDVVELER